MGPGPIHESRAQGGASSGSGETLQERPSYFFSYPRAQPQNIDFIEFAAVAAFAVAAGYQDKEYFFALYVFCFFFDIKVFLFCTISCILVLFPN